MLALLNIYKAKRMKQNKLITKAKYIMLKTIRTISGIEKLNRKQQSAIQGGRMKCWNNGMCTSCGHHCAEAQCCYCLD